TRGIHHQVVTALGGRPAHGTATLAAQAAALLAAEHQERGRVPVLVLDFSDRPRWRPPRPARLLRAA
ncbi:MAG TPA: hypothetical protein VMK84_26450, partial [Streptosporangiaceae bacterium]|nr:hypothetical protein [Streptosporangiaceae bacterium]